LVRLGGLVRVIQPERQIDSPALAHDKILSLSRLRGLTVLPLTMEGVDHALDPRVGAASRAILTGNSRR